MSHFFNTFEFEFEVTRLLWYIESGGADYGEVTAISEKIRDGDYESWYQEWMKFAGKLENRADNFTSIYSKSCAYLRASRYYQAAEFFLSPKDQRKKEVYQKSVELFYKGLSLQQNDYVVENISYKKALIRTVLFKTNKKVKGTLFVCGGFDALLEELYFTNVKIGLANGYDVVIYEGPGQSNVIREYNLPFEENWNDVSRVIVDFYAQKYKITENRIGIGLSLGGLLMTRAASLDETLFDKIVLYNYFPSMLDSFKSSMPKFLYKYIDTRFPPLLERICSFYIKKHKFLNWQIEHSKWTFGEQTLNDLLITCRRFNEEISYQQLKTDVLILLAENENYYDFHLGFEFFEKIPAKNKKIICFNKTNFSSDLHCQNGAVHDGNDQIFEWLQEN